MKIYTKAGDGGHTALFGGSRVSKASARVAAYGEVDELNSVIGLARAEAPDADIDATLLAVQSRLFDLGAELATSPQAKANLGIELISDADTEQLEQAIDRAETELAPLKSFVLPGGTRLSAALHLARTVCRRSERGLVALAAQTPVRGECIRYLNRLSDALFVLARLANKRAGVVDVPWTARSPAGG